MTDNSELSEAGDADLLYGVPAIARFLGLRDRQTYHLADHGLPVFKIGGKVCARRSTLRDWLRQQDEAARAAPTKGEPGSCAQ